MILTHFILGAKMRVKKPMRALTADQDFSKRRYSTVTVGAVGGRVSASGSGRGGSHGNTEFVTKLPNSDSH